MAAVAKVASTLAETARAALRNKNFIDGAFVVAESFFDVYDPTTGTVLAQAGAASEVQGDAAVEAAATAWKKWRKLPPTEHAGWLRKLADELSSRKAHIAPIEAVNTGKPLREAEGDVDDAIAALRYCAALAEKGRGVEALQAPLAGQLDPAFAGSHIRYEPVGVVLGITPWNFPLMMAAWKVGPALAAGCTLVLKPSEFTPFSVLELAAAAEAIKLPAGVLNIVNGPGALGAHLTRHPKVDKVTFTGSVPTGIKVMQAAAEGVKRVTLELGGKSPVIVFDDASLEAALEWVVFGGFYNCGQICSATARVLVQAGIAPEFKRRLVSAIGKLKQGSPFDEGVEIGPSCNKMQFDKVTAYIAQARAEGALLLTGGGRPEGPGFPEGGYWTAPTVFGGVTPAHTIFKEEVFGPVMTITTFETVDEAITLANDTVFGLAAAVFSKDQAKLKRVAEDVRAGVVWLNNAQPSPHAMPWGGFKKSGIGRELGPLALYPFLEVKAVTCWAEGSGVGWYPEEYFKA